MPGTGERTLTLSDGSEYHLLFTVDALMRAETQTKLGPMAIIERARLGELTMTELVYIVAAGIEGWRRRHSSSARAIQAAKVGEIIEELGFMAVLTTVIEALVASQSLGLDSDDEEQEEGDSDESPKAGPSSIALS